MIVLSRIVQIKQTWNSGYDAKSRLPPLQIIGMKISGRVEALEHGVQPGELQHLFQTYDQIVIIEFQRYRKDALKPQLLHPFDRTYLYVGKGKKKYIYIYISYHMELVLHDIAWHVQNQCLCRFSRRLPRREVQNPSRPVHLKRRLALLCSCLASEAKQRFGNLLVSNSESRILWSRPVPLTQMRWTHCRWMRIPTWNIQI